MDSYKLLVNLPDTVVFLSPELKILDATDDYLKAMVCTREELVGKEFLSLFPDNPDKPDFKNRQLLLDSLTRAIQSKKPDHLSARHYTIPSPESQGGGFTERYWEAVHKPVLGKNGDVEYVIHKTTDVTQRKAARDAAKWEESKYMFMMNALPQLIFTADATGTVTFFNKRCYEYTGARPEVLEEHGWQHVVHPDDLPKMEGKVEEAIRNGTELQAELRLRSSRGNYRWFITRCVPMRDEQGNVLMWVGSAVDIHDTRQLVYELEESYEKMVELSEQLQQAYVKAEAERKMLQQLNMKAPVFFCVLRGPEHRYELVNEKYQKLMPNKHLIGKSVAEALPEVAEQGFVGILDEVYATGKDYVAENIPVMIDRYDMGMPEQMHLTFIYQAIYNENQKITGIMVCGYDMAEKGSLTSR